MMDICALRLAVAFLVDHWPVPFSLILTVGPTLCKSFLCMYHIIIACKWKKPWVLPECVCVWGWFWMHVNSITASGLASSLRKRSIDMVTRMLPRGLKPLSHLRHYFSAPSIRKKLKCRGQEYWFWVGGGKAHQTGGCQKGTTFLWFSTSHWSHLCWTSASMWKPVRRSWRNRCSPLAHFAVWSLLTDVSWAFGSQVLSMNVLFFLWAQTFGSVGENPAIATSLKTKPVSRPGQRHADDRGGTLHDSPVTIWKVEKLHVFESSVRESAAFFIFSQVLFWWKAEGLPWGWSRLWMFMPMMSHLMWLRESSSRSFRMGCTSSSATRACEKQGRKDKHWWYLVMGSNIVTGSCCSFGSSSPVLLLSSFVPFHVIHAAQCGTTRAAHS